MQSAQKMQSAQREEVAEELVAVSGSSVTGKGLRDLRAAGLRASIKGRARRRWGKKVATGNGEFADDTSPDGALVAVADGGGGWAVAETLTEALRISEVRAATRRGRDLAFGDPAWRLGSRAQDDVRKARLPRARRLLVRTGHRG